MEIAIGATCRAVVAGAKALPWVRIRELSALYCSPTEIGFAFEVARKKAELVVVTGSVTAESSFKDESAKVYGIELDDHIAVSDLEHQVIQGDLGRRARVLGRAAL